MTAAHGYTPDDLDRLARMAVARLRFRIHDYGSVRDAAWSGIAEALCSATEAPTDEDLIRAGYRAANIEWDQALRSRGLIGSGTYRPEPGSRFTQYWDDSRVAQFPEDRIVDHLAAVQVLPLLTPAQKRAAVAVSRYDDLHEAAESAGVSYQRLLCTLVDIRKVFRRAWHDGETPAVAELTVACRAGHSRARHEVTVSGKRRCRKCLNQNQRNYRANAAA